MKKKNAWRVKGTDAKSDVYGYVESKSESRRDKEYCSIGGKLMIRTMDYDSNTHRKMLRSNGCYSDIFTARTPEELHEIADNELKLVTRNFLTRHSLSVFLSWRDFYYEMRCLEINESQWIKYRNRDACDDLVREGHNNIGLIEKINDTHKKMMYLCFRVPGEIEIWSVDTLMDAWKNSTGKHTWRSLRIKDFLSKENMVKVICVWVSWIEDNPKPETMTTHEYIYRFYCEKRKIITVIGVRNLRHMKNIVSEYDKRFYVHTAKNVSMFSKMKKFAMRPRRLNPTR